LIVFFLGMGASALLVASTTGVWSLAAALTLMGVFASIYHPVGIPMLVQGSKNPGFTIGVNGLFGNLGIAVAAILTGLLVKHVGWRAAFAVPGGLALLCAVLFAMLVPRETEPPARRPKKSVALPPALMALAQLVVGKLIDRYPLKWVYLPIVAAQAPLFLLASSAGGWPLYAAVLGFMVFVFGAIPFVDAMIVQYVDDRMRSRVAGVRLTVS